MRRNIRFPIGPRRITSRTASIGTPVRNAREAMKEIEFRYAALIKNLEAATPDALEYALQPIFDKSQIYVPVLTEALKESGVIEAHRTSTGAKASVGYGVHGDPFYAIYVHERVDLQHEPPTQALFLRRAVEEEIDNVRPRVIKYLRGQAGV